MAHNIHHGGQDGVTSIVEICRRAAAVSRKTIFLFMRERKCMQSSVEEDNIPVYESMQSSVEEDNIAVYESMQSSVEEDNIPVYESMQSSVEEDNIPVYERKCMQSSEDLPPPQPPPHGKLSSSATAICSVH